MTASTLNTKLARLWPREFTVSLAWSWDDWAWGYCTEFADLGMTALVLGPLHIQFDWAIV